MKHEEELTFIKSDEIDESYKKWESERKKIIWLLAFCGFVNPFAAAFFFPAQNVIMDRFETSVLMAVVCIQIFNVFGGICPFLVSPFIDKFGRRMVLCVALPLFILAQLLSPFAPDIYVLSVGRALAGAAVAPIFGAGTSIIFDVYPPETRA